MSPRKSAEGHSDVDPRTEESDQLVRSRFGAYTVRCGSKSRVRGQVVSAVQLAGMFKGANLLEAHTRVAETFAESSTRRRCGQDAGL